MDKLKKLLLIGFVLALYPVVLNEIRGDFFSLRQAAGGAFLDYMDQLRVDPTLFSGPYLDLASEKYVVFAWKYTNNQDSVIVRVFVPPYFYGFRTRIGATEGIQRLIKKNYSP